MAQDLLDVDYIMELVHGV